MYYSKIWCSGVLPVNAEDDGSQAGQKFRSIEEIRQEFESLNVDMKTDLEILDETLQRYRQTEELSNQERLAILSNLEYYLHQVLLLECFVYVYYLIITYMYIS